MKRRNILSAYTPSNTDPELLERVFVQRQRLRDKLIDRLARSATTGDKHHALLIGPRGCGKTNLVTLIIRGLGQRAELTDTLRIAWLGEDDTFAKPIHLALAIADRLAKEYSDEFDAQPRDAARGLFGMDAANAVLRNIVKQLGTRTLLVVTENFDRTLGSFGDLGQKQWRAFLQETGRFATLATAQQLTDDMSSRDKPFFGFFDIHHLKPLSVEDAHDLIRKIGVEQGKTKLAAYLDTAEGRYRVRALHHLAGGNHRMYVLLAEFLTYEALENLVDAFESLADELTPYFQERIRSLSPQQATLVECLCSHARAMTVKEIAETTFVEERTCAKQLGNLRRKSYVVSQKRGKESYYDMAEPLMRLCLEVKNQRGGPLKTLARFLRAWFPEQELRTAQGHSSRTDAYLKAALAADPSYNTLIASDLQNQIRLCLERGLHDEAAGLADELKFIQPDAPTQVARSLNDRGIAYIKVGDTEKAIADFTRVIKMGGASDQVARALLGRAILHQLSDTEKAIADFTCVIELPEPASELLAAARLGRGALLGLSDAGKAIVDLTHVIEMDDAPFDQGALLLRRALTYQGAGDFDEAIADHTRVIELTTAPLDQVARALDARGTTHFLLGNFGAAIADYTRVVELTLPPHQIAAALLSRGAAHSHLGDSEKAHANFTHVIELTDAPPNEVARALLYRGLAHWETGRYALSERALRKSIARLGASSDTRTAALFTLPEPMVATSDISEVVSALEAAFEQGDPASRSYGKTSKDLLAMVLSQKSDVWQIYAAALTPLYVEHEQISKLGYGLTQSIAVLDEEEFSGSKLDLWLAAWQQAGAGHEDLEIALKSLDAAIDVIKTKSDRPLFRLPPEIRELIRPLLKRSLGEE